MTGLNLKCIYMLYPDRESFDGIKRQLKEQFYKVVEVTLEEFRR